MGASWHIHFADARGRLQPWRSQIEAAIMRTQQRVSEYVPVDDVDIVVQESEWVIHQRGHVGYAPSGWLVHMSFDPTSDAFESNLGEPLERTLAHEINHVLRWRGPGYGATLGEALTSEGLAGVFVRQLFDTPPEPWEEPLESASALSDEVQRGWTKAYDHDAWFFGTGRYPAWAGYRVGYQVVSYHVDRVEDDIVSLTGRAASEFKTSARMALQ